MNISEMNEILFAVLITLNAISIILTFCLLSFGGNEANLPNKIGKIANKFAALCLSFLLVWFFIDALHDTILFTRLIS